MASRTAPRKATRNGSGSCNGTTAMQKSTTSSTKARSPKLRDSCDPCAAAKVRCTKQKPICTRCEKRGIQCEYIVTRRAGRPSQNPSRTASKAMESSYEPQQDDLLGDNKASSSPSPPPTTTLSETSFLTSPSLIEPSPIEHQMDICRTYSLPNLNAPCSDSLSDSPSLRCFADEVDSFFATLESLPGLETSSRDMLSLPSHMDSMNSSANTTANDPMNYDNLLPHASEYELPFTEDPGLDMLHLTPQWQTLPQANPTTAHHAATPPSDSLPCSCLTIALSLLRDLGPCTSSSKSWPQQDHSASTTLPSLISSNESTLSTITQILSCACSQDIYLLTMLSLVVFKALDRYAAAVTMTTEANHHPVDHIRQNTHNSSSSNNKFRSNSSSNHSNSTPGLSPTSFSTPSSSSSCSLPLHQSYQPHHHPFTPLPPSPLSTTTTTITTNDTTTISSTNPLHLLLPSDPDPRRVSAQIVLGELHHAQRLVNELSTRFRSLSLSAAAPPLPPSSSSSSPSLSPPPPSSSLLSAQQQQHHRTVPAAMDDVIMSDGDGWARPAGDGGGGMAMSAESSRPISTTMLEHLEKDLRARVRGVSKGVVDVIRRF